MLSMKDTVPCLRTQSFDVVIIGGGLRRLQCRHSRRTTFTKTAIIESRGVLGGTCLNVGCMPSKARCCIAGTV